MGKKLLAFVLAMVLFVSVFSLPSFADAQYISGDWSYAVEGGGAKILSYSGADKIVTIPEKLRGNAVLSIGENAFEGTAVSVLNLPESLKKIEDNAFYGSNVKAVYIPRTCTVISSTAFENSVYVFGFEGTAAQTYATTTSNQFISVAQAYGFVSYVGRKIRINTPHAFTLRALDSFNTVNGRYIIGSKVGMGKVSITFSNGISAVLAVKVKAVPKAIANLPTTVNLYIGDSKTLQPSISNGIYPQEDFAFKSNNIAVAPISNKGKITGIAPGSTTVVVAYASGLKTSVKVNVGYETTKFNLNKHEYFLGAGEPAKVTYTIGKNEVVKKVTYTSSNSKVAEVASNGQINAKKVGTAVITATTYNGLTDTCVITVGKAPTKVALAKTAITMGAGEKVKFKVKIDKGAVCSSFIWRSGDTSIFTVTDKGEVKAKKPGTAKLYVYTYNYKSRNPYIRAAAKITVKKAPSSIAFNKSSIALGVGETFDLNLKLPANSDSYKKQISVSNSSIFSVGDKLLIKGKKVGKATITLTTFNGKKATCKVTVKPAPQKVKCKPDSFKLSIGQSRKLNPYVNTGACCSTYKFKTSNKNVCTVSAAGVVKAKDYGTCYIHIYTYNHTSKKPVTFKVKVNVGYITNKLEYYTTYFVETDYGKSNNIKMACKYINGNTDGYILQPGEVFSFNDAVGPRTSGRGFQEAYVIQGGTYVPGIGGGICQVATTIFDAALYANCDIVERWNHDLKSGYVPIGRDATVFWGSQDLKFRNNYNTPIRLKMNYDPSGVLNATIYSLDKIKLPKIKLDVTHSGGVYTLRRYAGGKCNYVTTSSYLNA